ncbi:Ig-like domain-containing protein [Hymenobacter sp. GOD-10R]|uniref:Ig-like domain-containing protein n=1 Tax=Hymenobacter sp. GOD-10R TaxID=3093922 RepID=UPI002D785F7D|nr:Ig-like domain-containing protein [Hymenobacter sp. GOD-10R]WRQ28603.1 Ig-like domain-containing protein [Hymenobacter sp. GOD-10R]
MSVLFGSMLLTGCAAISSPQGGPRDKEPPKMTRSIPANGARNVTNQSIRLEFSETVQLKDLQKNLVVAPVISDSNRYKIKQERTAITLTYEKPLAKNTTYSFNFGNAITDITESNVVLNPIVAFSTGAELDSGRVDGRVTDLLTARVVPDVAVMLYPQQDTANIRRGRPYYLTHTDKKGTYSFRYIKEGNYRLFALADKNQNNRYNEGEKIAYLPDLITVKAGLDSIPLVLTRPDARKPLVVSQTPGPVQFKIGFNEGVTQVNLAPLAASTAPNSALNDAVQLAERGRTVNLYRTNVLTEGRYVLAATDSVGNNSRDTINVRFPGTPPPRRGAAYTVEGNPKEINAQGQLRIQFADPIRLLSDKPFATLVEDSTKQRSLRIPTDAVLNTEREQLTITLNTKAKNTVTIRLDSTVLASVTDRPLRLKPIRLRITEQSNTGTLSGTIETKYPKFQLQVINNEFQPIAVLNNPKGTFRFDNLAPGAYRLRVLVDLNGDGKWSAGDPNLKIPAEPVYFYTGLPLAPVRANWEQEDIKLKF